MNRIYRNVSIGFLIGFCGVVTGSQELLGQEAIASGVTQDDRRVNAIPSDAQSDAPIEVDAESMNYDRENGRITASGNVIIVSGSDRLEADRVLVNVNSGDLYAIGNVVLQRGGEVLRGDNLHYNTRTRVSSLDKPSIDSEPFRVSAENVTRTGDNTYKLRRAKITTCEFDHPHTHYHVRARDLEVVPGEYLKAKHAVWYFGRLPVMYVPYWRKLLHDEYGWRFYPGYRSEWGGFLLSSFFHRITPNIQLQHHLDIYSERGVGLGEDINWRFEGGAGQVRLYYVNDDKPNGVDPPANPPDIDPSRYRIFLRHEQQFDAYTRLLMRNEYVSDSAFRRDFFDSEYRDMRQPENYVTLSHQQELFTVTALANFRLNDFYSNVNRLPELSLNWYRMQLGDSTFYYQSETSAAFLQRVFAESVATEDYSTFRIDSLHSFYQPRRIAGWLNLLPRAGYRATYYANSRETETVANPVIRTVTNETTSVVQNITETNTTTIVKDGSAQFRQVVEVGADLSFKAFKRLQDSPGGQPWRHVVEPYINYTFRLEPSVLPDEIYQYDAIDAVDKAHQAKIGIRNLLQTKWDGVSVEAADVDIYTVADLDTEGEEDTFNSVFLNTRFKPAEWMQIDTDGQYNLVDSELSTFNTRVSMSQEEGWYVGLEHRFRNESSNLLILNSTFAPNSKWGFNVFSRYEFEESRLEEQGGYIQRNYDCISVRLGGSVFPSYTRSDGSEEEADYRVLLGFWLTDFPEMGLDGYGR